MIATFFDILYCRMYLLRHHLEGQEYAYATSKGESLKLDIYQTEESEKPAPVIIFLHGGAWKLGSRKNFQSGILQQAFRGYTVVGVHYTLSQKEKWPSQAYETKAAIRWLRAHAEELNINPNCIVLWGISSGGHIASVVGASNGVAELEGDLGHAEQSSEVQGVIAWYPPTDFMRAEASTPIGERGFRRATMQLLGANKRNYAEKADRANPITYINSASAPFLIQHGSWDNLVPVNQSELLYEALEEAGIPVKFELLPTYVHGDLRFNSSKNLVSVEAFLDEVKAKPSNSAQ